MAGYLTRLQGYVYDGEYLAATDLKNGQFVNIASNKATALSGVTDTKAKVVALEGPFGMDGVRADVVTQGDSEVYMVENVQSSESVGVYDETTFGPAAGEAARIHRLMAGEEFIVSSDILSPANFIVGDWFWVGQTTQLVPSMAVTKTVTKIVDVSEEPDADITGAAMDTFVLAEGDKIVYAVTVENTGDLPLAAIVVDDEMNLGGPQTITTLAVGATSGVIAYDHTVTALEAGTEVSNTVTATCAHPRRAGVNITATAVAASGYVAP